MPETPGFFPASDSTPLCGVYHAPGGTTAKAVVIAPPLFEERKSAYGAMVLLARGLAAAGCGVLRFDYRGSGESGGEGGQRRWNDLAGDLDAACAAVRKLSGCEKVALIGARLSATLILTEAARLKPERVVAIAPILKGATEVRLWRLRSKMRSELGGEAPPTSERTAEGALDLDGFPVHAGFFDDLQKIDLSSRPAPVECPTLLIQISHRENAAPDYERLASALGPQAQLACIKALPFWERVENADTGEMQRRVAEFVEERAARSE
jgi:alpha-beta hydrolase superfamily lysophospholipase